MPMKIVNTGSYFFRLPIPRNRQPENRKNAMPVNPNHYDALLTYARLLSELQSGEPEISWQKITPISPKNHQKMWQHLLLIVWLVVLTPLVLFLDFQYNHTLSFSMLFMAAMFFLIILVFITELPDVIRILRAPSGSMQPENFTLYFWRTSQGKYSYYPKNTLGTRCDKYLPDWDSFTLADWQALLPDAPNPEALQQLIHAIKQRLAEDE